MVGCCFPTADYLARIGLTASPRPDVSGLHELHQAQFFAIPFENLDILLGRGVDLAAGVLVDKLVNRRRGGYCFELNGLMELALTAFGFETRPLLARVHLEQPPSGRTHQLNLVTLEGKLWTMDVGFGGGGPRLPLPLAMDRVVETGDWAGRFVTREPWGIMFQTREAGQWKDSYSFDLSLVTAADIGVGNHYTSTSPDSKFTRTRLVSLPTAGGRISLRDQVLTEIGPDGTRVREIAAGQPYQEILQEMFGLGLDFSAGDLPPMPDA